MSAAAAIRVLVVDDEAPARAKLQKLLKAEPGVEVVGEAADGEAAVAAIQRQRPDLVLLDVQMPRLDGFGVIERVGVEAMPRVVFVTAFDEHALKAFEVHALDYLLKPFAPSRLSRVLSRVRGEMERESRAELARRLEEALAALAPAAGGGEGPGEATRYLRRLHARRGEGREALVPVGEIDLLRARGNYVELHTAAGVFSLRATLGALEERLDPEAFLRINRGEIVRLDAVAELQPWFHGDYRVLLKGGGTLTWSRRYRARRPFEL